LIEKRKGTMRAKSTNQHTHARTASSKAYR
jgi:hypothetical protein